MSRVVLRTPLELPAGNQKKREEEEKQLIRYLMSGTKEYLDSHLAADATLTLSLSRMDPPNQETGSEVLLCARW